MIEENYLGQINGFSATCRREAGTRGNQMVLKKYVEKLYRSEDTEFSDNHGMEEEERPDRLRETDRQPDKQTYRQRQTGEGDRERLDHRCCVRS